MNILSKIIFTTISVILLTFLILVTYLTNTYTNTQLPFYENIKLGLFELKNKDSSFSVNEVSDISSGKIYVKVINASDKIYFSSGNVEVKEINGITNISITPGIYYFDFKKLNPNYKIKGNGFEINNKGPGSFIVNNLITSKSIVFSINSLVELNLNNEKTDEKITSVDLFPHTYLIFNPIKNIFVKNSDLLKISQNFTLGYFKDQITNKELISEKFLSLISMKELESENIIKNIITKNNIDYKEKSKIYNNFIKGDFIKITGEELITQYSEIFINPGKISTFHKNIILRNLNELLKDEKVNPDTINTIIKSIKVLEKTDKKGLKEINEIITFYYNLTLNTNNSINTNINITNLYKALTNEKVNLEFKSLVSLEKIFFQYDFINNDGFYREVSNFRENYFNDINKNLKGINNNVKIEKMDYLLFFMENIILTSDFSGNNIDTKDLIMIFVDYVQISNSFYIKNDEKIIRTGIFTNTKILNKFINLFNDKYFEKNRNENGILVKKEDQKINNDDIILLESNINKLINFFHSNKSFLLPNENTKDKIVIDLYAKMELDFNEYFSAFKNYKEYSELYDKNKNNLLTTHSINENIDNNVLLTESAAKTYLSKFNGTNLNNTTVKIMDYNYCQYPSVENDTLKVDNPYCYKIDNLNVDGKNISLLLHPFEKNRIDEIVIENSSKSGSYKLDEIKIELDEKYNMATDNREDYDFYNFFIAKFGQKVIAENNNELINTDTNNLPEEDTVIKIFKRNKLLGTTGDFSSLNGFLDINYNDLIVKKELNGEYSIFVKGAKFNSESSEKTQFTGKFSSNYDFSKKHSFINPELQFVDEENKITLLLGNTLSIVGEYKVDKIKEEIKKVMNGYSGISSITNSINRTLNINEISIKYTKLFNQFEFNILYNGKILYIKTLNGNIIKFTYNNKSYINGNIKISDIEPILENIKI